MNHEIDWQIIVYDVAITLEKAFDTKLYIDRVTIDELDEKATQTLQSFNQDTPSYAKRAGNVVFWIKKLKPLSRAVGGKNDCRFINELLAVLVGVGICNHKFNGTNEKMKIPSSMLQDLASSLRYHSHSPNSVALIFESLMIGL